MSPPAPTMMSHLADQLAERGSGFKPPKIHKGGKGGFKGGSHHPPIHSSLQPWIIAIIVVGVIWVIILLFSLVYYKWKEGKNVDNGEIAKFRRGRVVLKALALSTGIRLAVLLFQDYKEKRRRSQKSRARDQDQEQQQQQEQHPLNPHQAQQDGYEKGRSQDQGKEQQQQQQKKQERHPLAFHPVTNNSNDITGPIAASRTTYKTGPDSGTDREAMPYTYSNYTSRAESRASFMNEDPPLVEATMIIRNPGTAPMIIGKPILARLPEEYDEYYKNNLTAREIKKNPVPLPLVPSSSNTKPVPPPVEFPVSKQNKPENYFLERKPGETQAAQSERLKSLFKSVRDDDDDDSCSCSASSSFSASRSSTRTVRKWSPSSSHNTMITPQKKNNHTKARLPSRTGSRTIDTSSSRTFEFQTPPKQQIPTPLTPPPPPVKSTTYRQDLAPIAVPTPTHQKGQDKGK
ncbi:hypothetical protein F5Y17DRAFT_476961 [Xylariaceae sp. FL0594]|nr:hypothetical protein F5Y17DRAFT_476961 [Xylariaceae sp. FL0594]